MSLKEINIIKERIENIWVIRVQGVLNAFTASNFTDEIIACLKKGPMILDMEDVQMVSSSGISALKAINDNAFILGNKIILLNPTQMLKQVFQMAGIKNLFLSAANEEIAMKMAVRIGRK